VQLLFIKINKQQNSPLGGGGYMWEQKGFVNEETDLHEAMNRLDSYIESLPRVFKKISVQELLIKPNPGKWSKQEILGHLIDSAVNNLKRFTEIQFLPQPYIVIPYQQEDLVLVNNYQQLPLEHLLNLWQTLNRQIIFVVKNISSEKLNNPVNPKYDSNEMKTLEWIIKDYVAHLEHHFKQIFRGN